MAPVCMCRMVEADSGSISIDGVNIRHVGLKQLRSQMSIIPQDPFMFSGTVRSNLDPFQAYAEHDLWRVLEAVGLKDTITALQLGLDAPVVDGGNNFSQVRRVHGGDAGCWFGICGNPCMEDSEKMVSLYKHPSINITEQGAGLL